MSLQEEALLLRQVAALRRAGLGHAPGLEAAGAGLPPGDLRLRTDSALRRLTAGEDGELRGMDRALSNGAGPVEALDVAALAVEAQVEAQEALSTTRLYLGVALAGIPLTTSLLAWASLPLEQLEPSPDAFGIVLAAARTLGFPLAILGGLLASRIGYRWTPGAGRLLAAHALLDASGGPDPGLDALEQRYLASRRAAVGPDRAAREVSEELVASARRSMEIFRWTAPLLGAILLFPFFSVLLALSTRPLFTLAAWVE